MMLVRYDDVDDYEYELGRHAMHNDDADDELSLGLLPSAAPKPRGLLRKRSFLAVCGATLMCLMLMPLALYLQPTAIVNAAPALLYATADTFNATATPTPRP
ncbi:hypothetical protein SDRG_08242 [Saprolegnia diclina VS20]|uniref:Transmembrane protein n=1 Tax=Saprolegnia diclina (strain VS20) TaxID=1156394 RepID=T0QH22_SAPDV|nr:hypothetical protein SDRG_08242 [Saprolegnia diclina VS20]EQC34026.1 hypothetical protein SDRG_08242 [Saprolegnia diclina VS20]|eukprot:XP_008612338.1 hypothetical protein SDRG_08242 [Saprolegnia diclina VS20]